MSSSLILMREVDMFKRRVREAIKVFCREPTLKRMLVMSSPQSIRTFCHVLKSINHVTKHPSIIRILQRKWKIVFRKFFSLSCKLNHCLSYHCERTKLVTLSSLISSRWVRWSTNVPELTTTLILPCWQTNHGTLPSLLDLCLILASACFWAFAACWASFLTRKISSR